MDDMFGQDDMDFPETEDEGLEGESSNRTFIIAASVLGGIILLSLVCVAAYALVIAPRQKQQVADADMTRVAQNTEVAQMLTETAVANELAAASPEPSPTLVASPTASPTPVIAVATDTPTPTPDVAVTATLAAALTQAAQNALETPAATLPAELTNTGFADDVGIPGLLGMMVLLVVVIFFARRLRQASAK